MAIFSKILLLILLLPLAARAIPDDEKKRGCLELASKVLPVQRKIAIERCIEFATNECERIERQFKESCLENSHSDNAIRYDMERGNARYCEAALMKREAHRNLCDGLRKECHEVTVAMGGGGNEGTCTVFRDDNDKKICVEAAKNADRIIASEKIEKEKCAAYSGAPKVAEPTTSHGRATNVPAPAAAKPAAKKP